MRASTATPHDATYPRREYWPWGDDPARSALVDYERRRVPDLGPLIRAYEDLTRWVRPARVHGIAVNTAHLTPEPAAALLERIERETGLPSEDVVRGGASRLATALTQAA